MEAWNSFLIIATHHTPSRSLELVQYQALVSHLFRAYPIQVAIRYDQLFHQAAARDPLLHWDTLQEDLLVWCSTRRSFRAPTFSRLGLPTTDPTVGYLPQQPPPLRPIVIKCLFPIHKSQSSVCTGGRLLLLSLLILLLNSYLLPMLDSKK